MTVGASWKEVTLEDHVDLVVGYAFKSSGYTDDESDVRLLRGDNVAQGELRWDKAKRWPVADYQRYEAFHLREGDIILAMDRPWISAGLKYARVKRKDTPSLLVQRVARLRGTESLKTDYLRCVIGSADFTDYVLSILTGVNIPHISAKDIKRFRFLLPPVATQERISRVITSYDDLIENNTRRIEILEEMARRLYEEWFVQFRFPGHEGVKFKESELGLIPEDWKVSTLDEFGEIITGKTPSKNNSEFFGGVVPFIKLPDMHGNTFIIETSERLSEEGVSSQKTKTIPPGSICVSCIGTAGVVVITSEPSQTNQQINSIVPRAPGLREFLFFSATALKEKINNYGATGATMTNLSRGKFASLQVVEPKEDLLCGYNKLAAPLFDKILCLQKANRNLRAQRDLLLPKLISGEIDVSDIPMPT
ncbi:restriction endonuclease subunit S [Pseudomonas putida]|uniref:restriction endonuclease subunit S n=1 Tax=Pseudomonas putida TaxID=303 RepID=UPI001075386A|nr:restriction endonuclease subunit S [Pseudomonas putida]MCG3646424.1 restriction endonuclease subunit S [Pseudomonas putida]TFW22662.1 restriction endonuclease subunit S [Pseudomonas putida]